MIRGAFGIGIGDFLKSWFFHQFGDWGFFKNQGNFIPELGLYIHGDRGDSKISEFLSGDWGFSKSGKFYPGHWEFLSRKFSSSGIGD